MASKTSMRMVPFLSGFPFFDPVASKKGKLSVYDLLMPGTHSFQHFRCHRLGTQAAVPPTVLVRAAADHQVELAGQIQQPLAGLVIVAVMVDFNPVQAQPDQLAYLLGLDQ